MLELWVNSCVLPPYTFQRYCHLCGHHFSLGNLFHMRCHHRLCHTWFLSSNHKSFSFCYFYRYVMT